MPPVLPDVHTAQVVYDGAYPPALGSRLRRQGSQFGFVTFLTLSCTQVVRPNPTVLPATTTLHQCAFWSICNPAEEHILGQR